MRTLCLLLILANALFLIWSQLIDAKVNPLDRGASASSELPPRIVLAREVSDDRPEGVAPVSDIQNVPPASEDMEEGPTEAPIDLTPLDRLTCTSVGPFADLPQAAQAQAALRSAGYEHARQRVEEGELWVGYWVSVPDMATRDDAERAVRALRAQGVTDVYLMPGADPGYSISLGVFSDYQRAQRRAAEVRSLGFEPNVQDRRRTGSMYWVDVELPEPGHALDLSLFHTGMGRITRLELRACPAGAAG